MSFRREAGMCAPFFLTEDSTEFSFLSICKKCVKIVLSNNSSTHFSIIISAEFKIVFFFFLLHPLWRKNVHGNNSSTVNVVLFKCFHAFHDSALISPCHCVPGECSDRVCDLVSCANGGICFANRADGYICLCQLGFRGALCEESESTHFWDKHTNNTRLSCLQEECWVQHEGKMI